MDRATAEILTTHLRERVGLSGVSFRRSARYPDEWEVTVRQGPTFRYIGEWFEYRDMTELADLTECERADARVIGY